MRASVHSPGVALFQDRLVSIARAVSFPGGARLVRQGETSRGAFLIRTGEVEARKLEAALHGQLWRPQEM